MARPSVVVVVLNWNGKEDSIACLSSLSRVDYPRFTVVVVDNGSQDGSEDAIRKTFPQHHFIQTGRNLGYAGGNNAGIQHALQTSCDYVLVLNNDTEVDPGFLTAMVDRAEQDSHIGITGAAISYADRPQSLWAYGGGRFNLATATVRHVQRVVPTSALATRGHVHFYVTGCAILMRSEMLRQVGIFDTSYFHFCEDVDLCLRAERAGYTIAVAADARIAHKVSATTRVGSPRFLYYNLRSRLTLVARYGPPGSPRPWALAILWMRLWRPAATTGMAFSGWRALARAWRDFRSGATGPAPEDL